MFIKVSNLQFKELPAAIELPVDLQSAAEWLDDYKLPYETEKDVIDTYIRTWLLNCRELTFDYLHVMSQEVTNSDQLWCLDMIDSKYDAYKETAFRIVLPDEFVCHITDDYIRMWQPHLDDEAPLMAAEQLHMILYDFMCHHLPIKIELI